MKLINIFLTFLVLVLTACTQNNATNVENIELPANFVNQGNGQVDVKWWHSFEQSELTHFIEQGLQDNLSLKARELRLKSSAIDAEMAGADLYPDLNLLISGTMPIDDLGNIKSASLGLSSSWELDLWGRIAAGENRAYWDHQGQKALLKARANLVAGNITTAWLSLVSEQEKKLVLASQFKRTQDALVVISRRFSMGKNSVTNIWQQQKLLKSIEVQQAKNIAELYIHQQSLALWLGVTTDNIKYSESNTLPSLPKLPQIGVPADVLRNRPDIEQAFAKIKAANENLAVAISNQYPRFTLRANYTTAKNSVKDLFDDWSGNLISSLAMPLFDAGTKKSVVQQRKLQLKALIFDYQQVWLDAIASVNKVLVTEEQLLTVANNLTAQLDLAERTDKLTTIKYLNGKTNYINLLKAQESILSLERQLIDANKKLIINRVLLYRELSHSDFSSPATLPTTSLSNEKNISGNHS